MPRNDEPTFNRALAEVLRTRNPRWQDIGELLGAEQLDVLREGGRPDIFVDDPDGAPIIIETEYAPARTVELEAQSRLNKTTKETGKIIEQAIALCAPDSLRNVPQDKLVAAVRTTTFKYCLYSDNALSQGNDRWPTSGWLEGSVNDLAQLIEIVSVSERVVAASLETLEQGIVAASGRLQQATRDWPQIRQKIADYLHQEEGEQTSRMAMAIVANAITFHTIIAGTHNVQTVDELRTSNGILPKGVVLREWERILRDINYWPIFHIARQIMLAVPDGLASQILNELSKVSSELAASGVTRSHDLSGRMFQRLIADRKFLATFYTLPVSATLLAELAVAKFNLNWSDPEAITRLRIGDLASGTGTLLAAAYRSVLARHRLWGGDDSALHTAMMENALIAADIMPAATHLTTSMLSSVHPTHTFRRTQVHTLPYGTVQNSVLPISLGSLDFCSAEAGQDLFGTGVRVASGEREDEELTQRDAIQRDFALAHDSLDLVIMNPPFTRPTNHESANVPVPSFAGFATSNDEQRAMSRRLTRVQRAFRHQAAGHGNAGLASNFLDLAHLKCRPGGILALVLPLALVQGAAWRPARNLLATWYENITFVTIAAAHTPECAFSADTGMGEVLVVARKRSNPATEPNRTQALFANLHRRPDTTVEAMEIARHFRRDREAFSDIERITFGDQIIGTTYRADLRHGGCASAADLELAKIAIALESHELRLPTLPQPSALAMARLSDLGHRGLVHRDINGLNSDKEKSYRGPFEILPISSQATYPALWSHDADRERQLILAPDCEGQIRPGMEDKADVVWVTASRLHFNRDFRLNSQSLAAAVTKHRSIGGRAWPNFRLGDPTHESALVLWSNTTLGLFLFWWYASRQQAGRAILTISQLPSLLVIDTTQLTSIQIAAAERVFDKFAKQPLLPANEAFRDTVRIALDEDFLVSVLGLDPTIREPLEILRNKWCAEPSVHGGKNTRIQ